MNKPLAGYHNVITQNIDHDEWYFLEQQRGKKQRWSIYDVRHERKRIAKDLRYHEATALLRIFGATR